jgi:hypothetical protein
MEEDNIQYITYQEDQRTESQNNYKTPSYTLRAVRKYQEKNKEKINSKWRERYENDPEFREKQKQLSREKYQKKKLLML